MNNPIRMLSAIMFSDIVGYTSLMQEDDDLSCSQFLNHPIGVWQGATNDWNKARYPK